MLENLIIKQVVRQSSKSVFENILQIHSHLTSSKSYIIIIIIKNLGCSPLKVRWMDAHVVSAVRQPFFCQSERALQTILQVLHCDRKTDLDFFSTLHHEWGITFLRMENSIQFLLRVNS